MQVIILTLLLLGYACAAPTGNVGTTKIVGARQPQEAILDKDLNTDASTYYDRNSDYGSRGYPSGYGAGVTGYGLLDDRYGNSGYDTNGYGGYAGVGGYSGYSGYDGYRGGYGNSGYGSAGYGNSGYGSAGYGNNGYGNVGYGSGSYGNSGYGASYGNGGYGGYTGNGGLNSYYGYNNPSYQGYGHLGYGYYNKRPGNIYNSGITPSLVTGYRGYSRK